MSDLTAFFSAALLASPVSQADRARNNADLNECFKIFDALGLHREAEEVIRRELIRPFAKKVSHERQTFSKLPNQLYYLDYFCQRPQQSAVTRCAKNATHY